MRWMLYHLLFAVGYTLMMPKFLLRMLRRGGYRRHFLQRFGCYDEALATRLAGAPRPWMHAVSVGEVFVAGRIMQALRELQPGIRFVLSTTTSTGYRMAEQQVGSGDDLIYFPVDFPWAVKRALDRIRPTALILTESELWPTMIRSCARRGIPVVLVNGRVSDSSYPGYRRVRGFFEPVLRCFRLLLVQSPQDVERLTALGAPADRVRLVGTVKFDVDPPPAAKVAALRSDLAALGFEGDCCILMGGATWPGEEEALLSIYRELREAHPELRLLLVPRHAERGDEVEAEITRQGLHCLRRSRGDRVRPEGVSAGDAVLLADTTGEMAALYTFATVVFVGKSLTSRGGQNMIEPSALAKAVIVGPHTANFPGVMADFRADAAILEVADREELAATIAHLLEDAAYREACGQRAAACVRRHGGVLQASARQLLEVLHADA